MSDAALTPLDPLPVEPPYRRPWISPAWRSSLLPGLILLALPVLLALLPPSVDPAQMVDPAVSRHRPPGTVLWELHQEDGRVLLAEEVHVDGDRLLLLSRGQQRDIARASITNLDGDGHPTDRRRYWLGSDQLGRDVAARLVVGARISLLLGVLSVFVAMIIGVAIGALSASGGPWLDSTLMRLVDACMAFPQLFLLIALAAVLQPTTWVVVLFIGGTSWMRISRLTRAELLGLRNQDFVLAARGIGQRPSRILLRHLLPNALTPLVVEATLMIGDVILVETALSFFGFGVQPPTPSWGSMINDGRAALGAAPWVSLLPGIAIMITVIAFNLVGDGLRDWLDPKNHDNTPRT